MHPSRKRKAMNPALDLYHTASAQRDLFSKSNGIRPHEQQIREMKRM
jgi:hypothetical protein